MRFRSIRIVNLRGVKRFEISDLQDFIVIAGPNGSGKSCVFDAIRLLKSLYGGYSTDEYMQWFNEFAINPQDRSALKQVFRDPNLAVEIQATIEFSDSELEYMREHGDDLIGPLAWEQVTGQRMDYASFNRMAIATQMAQHGPAVKAVTEQTWDALRQALESPQQTMRVTIEPNGDLDIERCLPAEISFQAYQPEHLGIIEYHSASRAYIRQPLQGINLDPRAFEEQRRQATLFNWQAKYQNVRTELATSYVRNLVAEQAGEAVAAEDLNETLKELFRTFFPDKEYLGVRPRPDGNLDFPVRVSGGTHDIDDLSSGEKEILYGYLRLRNSTPRRSVVLLDEPELHLNPALLQGFADFYHRHLGIGQSNQLWLVTHSDTLLRQAVGNSNYAVYHMLTAATDVENQASEVLLNDDVERAVIDLVGDLAAYRPHAKVVILEGASEDGFDATFIRRLFPELTKHLNLVSAESRRRVKDLYEALDHAANEVGMANRFFAIVDRDAEGFRAAASTPEYTWDVYHIENFLLEPRAVRKAVWSLNGTDGFGSDEAVVVALREAAKQIVGRLVLQELQDEVNTELVSQINIGAPPDAVDIVAELEPSITRSVERFATKAGEYSRESLASKVSDRMREMEGYLDNGEWLKRFPGRLVLKRFVGEHLTVGYEPFRNLVLDNMAAAERRPENARLVLEAIIAA